ncbi:glycosyl hydrolase [Aquincola sp. S2]|uniref:Glycosyl hydrolase n=1 Tax=Pseudaquabacterium terrae TaxID=2732868 RepID=A0ABX2ETM6_9BURK|nr:YCF48-related protein [Aquabacterium terrae]NRF71997.1 glycosyl hydrolase [Aquabacterium terrae]
MTGRHVAQLTAATICAATFAAFAADFADPIATPARLTERALGAPVFALAESAGVTLGVGPRGHILRSTDTGRSWQQVPSPVSSDLVAVAFAGPRAAWAVGHDGVMLHSTDAGASWHKRLDGHGLGKLMVAHYEKLAAAQPGEAVQRALDEARKAAGGGAALSLLTVWFRDEREGFAAGQFNLLLHTSDGGASWQPWLERTDNPDTYSLHAIAGDASQVWIAGELGLVLRLVRGGAGAADRFERIASPYKGSWFGLDVSQSSVLLYGLRGNAWRSDDGGAHWRRLDTGTDQAINGGLLRPDGGVALLTGRGLLLLGSRDGALARQPRGADAPAAGYALLPLGPRRLALGTREGVRALELATPAP